MPTTTRPIRCWRARIGTRAHGREAVEAADKAIAIKPSNAQAHLWRADARRQMAAARTDSPVQVQLYARRARRLPHLPRPHELFERASDRSWRFISSGSASAAAGMPIARAPTTACAAPGSSACACRSRRSAIRSRRATTASARSPRAEGSDRATFCSATSIAISSTPGSPATYLKAARTSYAEDARDQPASRRIEERAELRGQIDGMLPRRHADSAPLVCCSH